MFDSQKFLENMVQERKEKFVNDMLASDVLESYLLFRRHDGSIDMKQLNYVCFDRNLSCEDSYNVDAKVNMSLYPNEDCFEKCSRLFTEGKQIKEYEEAIKQLNTDNSKLSREKNRWHSKYLCALQSCDSIKFLQDTEAAIERNDWFMLFVDNYSDNSDTTIIMQFTIPNTSDFFESDYWTELFTLDKRWSWTLYEPPYKTYNNMGYNPCFVICDAKSRNHAIQHLRYYPNEPYHIVQSDIDYVQTRLDEIWFDIFGKQHNNITFK